MAPQVQARLADAGDYAQRRKEEVLPVAAARLADGAAHARKTAHDVEVPDALEQALIKLTGDKAIVKRLRKGAEQYAGAAEKDLNRAAGRRASRSGGRAWIVAGMAAAAAGAGYALWRLTKPVQDPWTAPVPGPITAEHPGGGGEQPLRPAAEGRGRGRLGRGGPGRAGGHRRPGPGGRRQREGAGRPARAAALTRSPRALSAQGTAPGPRILGRTEGARAVARPGAGRGGTRWAAVERG
ncbi:hypothetical protein GY12_12070, partial [Micrococcus luteus]